MKPATHSATAASVRMAAWPSAEAQAVSRAADFVALTKPRLNLLVLGSTLAGLYLAAPDGIATSPSSCTHWSARRSRSRPTCSLTCRSNAARRWRCSSARCRALPPVIGWTAAGGGVTLPALVLFGIVFFWQMPHFLAIAWLYRHEYAAAGIPLLPVTEPTGRRTGRQALLYTVALWPVTLMPPLVGLAGGFSCPCCGGRSSPTGSGSEL